MLLNIFQYFQNRKVQKDILVVFWPINVIHNYNLISYHINSTWYFTTGQSHESVYQDYYFSLKTRNFQRCDNLLLNINILKRKDTQRKKCHTIYPKYSSNFP